MMTPQQEEINAKLNDICGEIEDKAAEIAGIGPVFSDYNLVSIRDWSKDDAQEKEILMWVKGRWKLGEEDADDKYFIDTFMYDRLMVLAIYILLNASGDTL